MPPSESAAIENEPRLAVAQYGSIAPLARRTPSAPTRAKLELPPEPQRPSWQPEWNVEKPSTQPPSASASISRVTYVEMSPKNPSAITSPSMGHPGARAP